MEYALKYQANLKGLIISNMMASIPEYEKYNGVLRWKMRKSLVDSLTSYEDRGLYKDGGAQRGEGRKSSVLPGGEPYGYVG
jgi:proline iminopeptidase